MDLSDVPRPLHEKFLICDSSDSHLGQVYSTLEKAIQACSHQRDNSMGHTQSWKEKYTWFTQSNGS